MPYYQNRYVDICPIGYVEDTRGICIPIIPFDTGEFYGSGGLVYSPLIPTPKPDPEPDPEPEPDPKPKPKPEPQPSVKAKQSDVLIPSIVEVSGATLLAAGYVYNRYRNIKNPKVKNQLQEIELQRIKKNLIKLEPDAVDDIETGVVRSQVRSLESRFEKKPATFSKEERETIYDDFNVQDDELDNFLNQKPLIEPTETELNNAVEIRID